MSDLKSQDSFDRPEEIDHGYAAPELTPIGSVEQLTLGLDAQGNDGTLGGSRLT